ncbi:hypothetical protein KSB_23750 [Ktedonobacter robiniae]|uniref:Uncharacterized protein n=1 Tax=Ktedonobacter robiniae TaxID=2778365 RepID=A0ABQ3UMH5_9CHLR|nr:hypothetical protein KSB_23750 [Ktedonobacter robiniae]
MSGTLIPYAGLSLTAPAALREKGSKPRQEPKSPDLTFACFYKREYDGIINNESKHQ